MQDDLFDPFSATEDKEIPDDAPHWKREPFIPLQKEELVNALGDEFALNKDEGFRQWCRVLAAILHCEYHRRLERLKQLYGPFNPDSTIVEITDDQHEAGLMVPQLLGEFRSLVKQANYQQLSRPDIEQAAVAASDWGVRLQCDFSIFDELEVFARGDVVGRRVRRRWRNLYRAEEVGVPIYQRLVIIFQLHPEKRIDDSIEAERVYLKIFKNIPKQDIDNLLPGGKFQMSLLDQGKIILPTLSGVAIAAFKILGGVLRLLFTGIFGALLFALFVIGTLGYGAKSFLGYLRTRDKYQLNLTRSLYYQNLDNNAGVLFRILDEAEEQDFREAIIAYAVLLHHPSPAGISAEEIDRAAEQFLRSKLGFEVDFEVQDALHKLSRLGCARMTDCGRWRAESLSDATALLVDAWTARLESEQP